MFKRRRNLGVALSFTGACEESVAGVDYWITKILVERGGWYTLEKDYRIRKFSAQSKEGYSVLPGTKIGTVISDLFF